MKLLREAILHIGPDKTGSTAIQEACHHNRTILKKYSILYPCGMWHTQLASCFYANPEDFIFNIQAGRIGGADAIKEEDRFYLDSLSSEILTSNCNILVLSSEGFAYLPEDVLIGIRDYILQFADKIRVIIYCREPLSYACSAISEKLRTGYADAFNVTTCPPIHEYRDYIERFRKVFGMDSVCPRLFSRNSMPNGDVVLDFIYAIGLQTTAVEEFEIPKKEVNTSLTFEAGLIAAEIARKSEHSMVGNEFYKRYQLLLGRIRGSKLRLTREQAANVIAAARPHLKYLELTYGIKLRPDESYIDNISTLPFLGTETLESLADIIIDFQSSIVVRPKGYIKFISATTPMKSNETATVDVEIINLGDETWIGSLFHPIYLSYHWRDNEGRVVVFDGARTALPRVSPGQMAYAQIIVDIPSDPGHYLLELTIVQEAISWFEEIGFRSAMVDVTVESAV